MNILLIVVLLLFVVIVGGVLFFLRGSNKYSLGDILSFLLTVAPRLTESILRLVVNVVFLVSQSQDSKDDGSMKSAMARVVDEARKKMARFMPSGSKTAAAVFRIIGEGKTRSRIQLAWKEFLGYDAGDGDIIKQLNKEVEAKNGEAMWVYGICKEFGIGTEQDMEKARDLYEESENLGSASGNFLASKTRSGRAPGEIALTRS